MMACLWNACAKADDKKKPAPVSKGSLTATLNLPAKPQGKPAPRKAAGPGGQVRAAKRAGATLRQACSNANGYHCPRYPKLTSDLLLLLRNLE